MLRITYFLVTLLVYFGYVKLPKWSSQAQPCQKAEENNFNQKIELCSENFNIQTAKQNEIDAINLKIDESIVAELGHVEGIKPLLYNLTFNFLNHSHYEASAEISIQIISETNKIVLNRHEKAPEIDYKRISLRPTCLESADAFSNEPINNCIERVILIPDAFMLILSSKLRATDEYILTIPRIAGESFNDMASTGSVGLRTSGANRDQAYYAATTIFQMRYARTVFPCFDYPNLKANFSTCIQRPTKWHAASNMPSVTSFETDAAPDGDKKRIDCFQTTPKISTYVFTIAVMENYTVTKIDDDKTGVTIELFSPEKKTSDLNWIVNASSAAIDRMQKITGFRYPLPRFGVFVVYPAPFWGIENFGLVTVEGAFLEREDDDKARTILNHEIVHQWLGDTTTVSRWSEICLQEGLTAFVEWQLTQELNNVSIESQANSAKSSARAEYYPSFFRRYNYTQDIADHCFARPPLFFKTITDAFDGFKTIERFLTILLAERTYGTADVKYWDSALARAVNDSRYADYLQKWFGQSGSLYLFARKTTFGDENSIHIAQGQTGENGKIRMVTSQDDVRPLPIEIITTAISDQTKSIVLSSVDNVFMLPPNASENGWFVIDPNDKTVTRKVYTLENYQKLAACIAEPTPTNANCGILTSRKISPIWSDFCRALLADAFPWNQLDEENAAGWKSLFKDIVSSKFGDECKCCLKAKPTEESSECGWQWNSQCHNLRIVKMVVN